MDATCEPQQENNILKLWNDFACGVFPPENTSWYSFQVYMAPRLRALAANLTNDPAQRVNRTWGESLQAQMLSQHFGFDPRFIVDGSDQARRYGSALRFQNSLPTGIAPGITLTNNRTFFGFKRHWSYIDQTGRPQETMGGGNCLYHAMACALG